MSQYTITKTKGLYRNTNELSESPEGSLLIADNVVIDRDSIIESRRGLDKLDYKFRDASDRAHNLFFYKDELIAHNSTNLMSYYDDVTVAITGNFSSGGNTITSISPNTTNLSVGQTVIGVYVFTITTVADVASSLNNKYFLFNSANNTTRYYGWFNVGGAGLDPNITGRTGVQITLTTNDSANTVASAIQAVINPLADFNASVLANVVTVTNAAVGDSDIARNGFSPDSPGFTFNNIGTGIPNGTVIDSIDSSTQVTVSQNFTETRTSESLSVAGWRAYNGTYTAPSSTMGRIRSASSNQNFYFVSNTGVKKLDSLTSDIISAGGIKAIDGEAITSGSSGFMEDDTQVAYRIVWGYKDANNNLILGVPSERIIVINSSGGTRDVQLTFFIPDGITEDYFYQIYRSSQSIDATVVPEDDGRLVIEDNPTADQITDGEIVVIDNTPESLRTGAELYTNQSQETILQANEIPPFAHDLEVFQNCMFYANTRTRERLNLTLLAAGGTSGVNYLNVTATYVSSTTFTVVSSTGIAVGMSITGPGAFFPSGLTVSAISGSGPYTITVTGGTISAFVTETVQFRDTITIDGVNYVSNDLTERTFDLDTTPFTLPDLVNATAHGLSDNSTVRFVIGSGGSLPPELTAGTTYYVVNSAANTFKVSATQGGTAIVFTGAGAGPISCVSNERKFRIYTSGTPAQNIENTAKALARTVNTTSANTDVYAYYLSGPSDLPGKLLFEGRIISVTSFSTTASSHGTAWNPVLPTSGTSVSSSNDEFKNGLYFSKPLQPEAVPLLNYLRIGDADKEILRIKRLRDALFVFKKDGIFRVIGSDPSTFRADLLDNTANIIAPESVVTLNNQIFLLADQGVAVVSDTGVEIISRQIENDFLDLFSLDLTDVAYLSFGLAYESDRKYILATISDENDTSPTQMYVYNTFTEAWTKWILNKNAGAIGTGNDRLYFADASSNSVNVERKARDYTDYADDEFEVTLSSFSDTVLTVSSTTNIEIGDLVFQDNTDTTKVIAIDAQLNTITVQDEIDWVASQPITIIKAIETVVEYIPEEAGNPGVTKQFREISVFFKEGFFDDIELSFISDISGSRESVALSGYLIGFWGLFEWGNLPWGGSTRQISVRTYIPPEKQRCSQLSIRLTHREGYSFYALNGLSLIFNTMSERLRR